MGSRPPPPSPPFQITFGSPSWRFQIQQGNNQQIVLSQWLQGQRSQQGRQGESLTEPPGQGQPVNSIETTVDISGSDNPVSNQSPSNEQTIPSTPPTTQATPNVSTNPFSAINQFLEQNPEMYGVLQTLLAYIPFLILILFKEIYKHTSDILVILALVVTFIHADRTVQREVSKQGKRELKPLGIIALNIVACVLLVHFLCGDNELYHSLLVFMPNSAPITLANLFWAVTTTDHILKLATVLFKGILTAIPIAVFPISRRGKCFAFIERSSHLYRALAAVPPWIHYLLNSQSSESSSIFFYDTLVGVCLCGIYLTCKAYRAIKLVRKWKLSVSKLLQSTRYGAHPSNEQLQNAGPMCPICHDGYRKPIFLSCKHIFCEDCLSMWLDRERTCPMCRSTVAEDPKWKDGSTSYLVQLF
ncbi:RING finger and transmembrane domain-containing protein 2-like [Daphnia pulex]|uniref:RING finger and transmembrane domain-containing protein 2-like n=1 Tax=Daphnia pulex TaxID=6669 RepID=UPI001EDCB52C|nr:RING finger and transmembrane domain-containing protein 2-like [Daphnia pulex]